MAFVLGIAGITAGPAWAVTRAACTTRCQACACCDHTQCSVLFTRHMTHMASQKTLLGLLSYASLALP